MIEQKRDLAKDLEMCERVGVLNVQNAWCAATLPRALRRAIAAEKQVEELKTLVGESLASLNSDCCQYICENSMYGAEACRTVKCKLVDLKDRIEIALKGGC